MTQGGTAVVDPVVAEGQGRMDPALRVLSGARVLIVDDDHLALRSLERTLRSQGVTGIVARSLPEARTLLEKEDFDAAVVDLRLESARGVELVGELRLREQPIGALMITGSRGTDVAREIIASGADDLLLKPFEARQFLGAVARTVSKTREWRMRIGVARALPEHDGGEGAQAEVIFEAKVDAVRLPQLSTAPAAAQAMPVEPTGPREPGASGDLASDDLLVDESGDLNERRRQKMLASPSLPTLGMLDIDACADELMKLGDLSTRERRVLILLLRGHSNAEIAQDMNMKERTIKFHVSNVLKKLRVTNRGDLVRFFF